MPNPDGSLRIAMTAQVTIVVGDVHDVLSIPSTALGARAPDGRYRVRVVDGPKTEERLVRIGLDNHVRAEVRDGLKAGELVVDQRRGVERIRSLSRRWPSPNLRWTSPSRSRT